MINKRKKREGLFSWLRINGNHLSVGGGKSVEVMMPGAEHSGWLLYLDRDDGFTVLELNPGGPGIVQRFSECTLQDCGELFELLRARR